jgi:hypothetical protein
VRSHKSLDRVPARVFLHGLGRFGEVANGRLLALQLTIPDFGWMAGSGKVVSQEWVGLRQSALQTHRRKAVSGIPLPGSGHLAVRTPNPKPTLAVLHSSPFPIKSLPMSDGQRQKKPKSSRALSISYAVEEQVDEVGDARFR